MTETFKVFYSWQSDLPKPTNLNGIRKSLRSAINLVEDKLTDKRIDIDEATRNTTGSPNIPLTIFAKISNCDVFICDLTTINSDSNENRKVPNPNVLIELGYAIATVGWERIIMLFNTNFGSFPSDLPFDIDRHRASPFSITDNSDKNGKNQLTQLLNKAIYPIIKESPLKPSELKSLSPEKRKRELDIKNLEWLMSSINIIVFDNFIDRMPNTILSNILHYKDCFYNITISSSFHIYDEKLNELVYTFANNWEKSLSFYKYYSPDGFGTSYKFNIPFDVFPNEQTEKDFRILTKICIELGQNFKDLLAYIRKQYLEIDLEMTSEKALKNYEEYNPKK
ncbi:TIR domain-containing protein [Tenacibaculum maritimum]|uniref:TIR domain-containing protein n=2 Tax=Tenacibaculum maritimum TaxID=107401 RepID=UPI0012E50A21|nr:TIR domain-containing protein [Tenacibaculum maritimum]CAA0198068.1 conserved hypothetical protein [Tenacibaculum maritimum]CAA0213005.1 conserved hypothetical protein [Tenacibaculum maritimum]